MIELYGLAPQVVLVFSAFFLFAVVAQSIRIFIRFIHTEHKLSKLVTFYEISVLLVLVLSALLLSVTRAMKGMVAAYLYDLRWLALLPILLGIWIVLREKRVEPASSALFFLPQLPIWHGTKAVYLFLFGNLYFLFRSIIMIDSEMRRVHESITKISIKEAVDTFPGGILYANDKGKILIMNPSMRRLLDILGIGEKVNAGKLWNRLHNVQEDYNISLQVLGQKLLFRIRNGGSWLFSEEKVRISRGQYIQFVATDISEEDLLTQEIEASNLELEKSGREISAAILGLEQLERQKEILKMKSRVHDVLGQRLSLLSRILDSDLKEEVLLKELKPLLMNLDEAIREPEDTLPGKIIADLMHSFSLIGTTVHLKGELPEAEEIGRVFAEIIRECATNAVRHGGAANVYILVQENPTEYVMSLQNDGTVEAGPVREGGGLTGIRQKIQEFGGTVDVRSGNTFRVVVRIPTREVEDHDQNLASGRSSYH